MLDVCHSGSKVEDKMVVPNGSINTTMLTFYHVDYLNMVGQIRATVLLPY